MSLLGWRAFIAIFICVPYVPGSRGRVLKAKSSPTPYFVSEKRYPIDKALNFCRHKKGNLVLLDSVAKFSLVTSILLDHVSLYDRFYVDARQRSGKVYLWSNGVRVKGSFWGELQPEVNRSYVQLKYSKGVYRLASSYGSYLRHALCEYLNTTKEVTSSTVNTERLSTAITDIQTGQRQLTSDLHVVSDSIPTSSKQQRVISLSTTPSGVAIETDVITSTETLNISLIQSSQNHFTDASHVSSLTNTRLQTGSSPPSPPQLSILPESPSTSTTTKPRDSSDFNGPSADIKQSETATHLLSTRVTEPSTQPLSSLAALSSSQVANTSKSSSVETTRTSTLTEEFSPSYQIHCSTDCSAETSKPIDQSFQSTRPRPYTTSPPPPLPVPAVSASFSSAEAFLDGSTRILLSSSYSTIFDSQPLRLPVSSTASRHARSSVSPSSTFASSFLSDLALTSDVPLMSHLRLTSQLPLTSHLLSSPSSSTMLSVSNSSVFLLTATATQQALSQPSSSMLSIPVLGYSSSLVSLIPPVSSQTLPKTSTKTSPPSSSSTVIVMSSVMTSFSSSISSWQPSTSATPRSVTTPKNKGSNGAVWAAEGYNRCHCVMVTRGNQSTTLISMLEAELARSKAELTLNKTSLSQSQRKLSSAYDSRFSSQTAGLVSVILMSLLLGGIVCSDLLCFFRNDSRLLK